MIASGLFSSRIRRLSRWAAAGMLAASLAGCVSIEQEVAVEDGGAGALTVRLVLDAQIVQLMKQTAPDKDPCLNENADKIKAHPEVTDFRQNTLKRGEQIACEMIVTFKSVDKVGEIAQTMDAGDGATPTPDTVIVQKTGERTVRILQDLGKALDQNQAAQIPDDQKKMVVAMFAGKNIDIVVKAPEILTANAPIAADKKSVRYSIPIADLIAGTNREKARVDVTLRY